MHVFMHIKEVEKLLSFRTESAINKTDFRLTPSKNFFANLLNIAVLV